MAMAWGQTTAQPPALNVEAPASLEAVARRIRNLDRTRLDGALMRAGLEAPPEVRITLLPEEHVHARATPSWIAGQAFGSREIVIFPARVGAYPHDSLETVVWHELVHLALSARAGERPLPRWFHEGVAMSVEAGWGLGSQVRLLLAAAGNPSLTDMNRLFSSDSQPQNATAYLLAAALVSDIRRRHGAAVPGAIAARVGLGAPFREAFAAETGELPEVVATRAWAPYRQWATWIPVVTGGSFVWLGIMLLAGVAFIASVRKRLRQRRAWDDEAKEEEQEAEGRFPNHDEPGEPAGDPDSR